MKKLKMWYEDFLKGLEKANKESFGDKKLDCCGLNSDKRKKPLQNKK
jgi:hypothetical protein